MAQRCAYLIEVHNISQELVVNTDQTGIHLVPTGGARTWETKGSKHVNVHGIEDKRQITVAVSSSATRHVLPFQVIFQGFTPWSLPPLNDGRHECINNGWHLTFSSNHWSTMETCKDFVSNVLTSYRSFQVNQMGLPKDQDMIWLIDCWSVYISKEFGEWMKATHLQIHVLFIPTNYTSIYQPTDVILQQPLKHAFRQEFNKYTMDVITKQIETNEDIKIDFKMSTLKPKLCSWLFSAWLHICNKQQMVQKRWEKCGLLCSFDSQFQRDAMVQNMQIPSFKEVQENQTFETNLNHAEDETDAEESLDTIMMEDLNRVEKLSTQNSTASIASIRGLAKKKKDLQQKI